MAIKQFKYTGPNSGISIVTGKDKDGKPIEETDVMLWNGSQVELPADNEHVQVMVAQGYLTEVVEVAAPASVADAPVKTGTKAK